MDLKLKIDPEILSAIVFILFSCLCLSGKGADAFRQVTPPTITPQTGPPAYALNDPSFEKWSNLEIVNSFKESRLKIINIKNGFTMGARAAKESTIFLVPSSGENIGGLVSSYSSLKALEADKKYYSAMNRPHAPIAWWIFQRENILRLISGKVPEEKAMRYREVLEGI